MSLDVPREDVADLAALGVVAFTTTRDAGTFGTAGRDPVGDVMGRWWSLVESLHAYAPRLATSRQVHGNRVLVHRLTWEGWLRADAADGHVSPERGTALAITVADCVPVFVAHPSGACALLHAGWRGTAAHILERGVAELVRAGLAARDLYVHLGPSICGRCYEVGPDVFQQLTGESAAAAKCVDLRAILARQAQEAGVTHVSISEYCTRCDNDRFFSHRAGDGGRMLAVIVAPGVR
ncbi:MAG TPA: polyphenol oxidase family protein [Gemmatimonadaceae bacterium]|nr:polyphenol oxidase family protein [Gemmatimonadaceae bacterium]